MPCFSKGHVFGHSDFQDMKLYDFVQKSYQTGSRYIYIYIMVVWGPVVWDSTGTTK